MVCFGTASGREPAFHVFVRIIRGFFRDGSIRFTGVMNPASDLTSVEQRLPVWEALSDFFLDTELDEQNYEQISDVLATSPYSIREMEDILRFELYPVLIWNLRSVAGEWAGFDRDWLRERIEPGMGKRPRIRLPLLQWGMVADHWKLVSRLVERKRKAQGDGHVS